METPEFEHVIEVAPSGRAKCRACSRTIAKGELRLGEKLANPFADGQMTQWFHLQCGAYSRPDALVYALNAAPELQIEDREKLLSEAEVTRSHLRLSRISGVGESPNSRAACRQCKEMIEKGEWRISLLFYEDGRFNPSGYAHVKCAQEYLGTDELVPRFRHYSPDLSEDDVTAIKAIMACA